MKKTILFLALIFILTQTAKTQINWSDYSFSHQSKLNGKDSPVGIIIALNKANETLNTVTGTWNAINASQSKAPVTEKVLKPVLIHHLIESGAEPSGYVLADCKTPQELEKLVSNPSWKVLCNDKNCQAVSFKDNTVAIAFFSAGLLKIRNSELTTDKPCLILVSGGKMYVSDPNHIGGKATIVFKGKKMVVDVPENGTTSIGVPFEIGN